MSHGFFSLSSGRDTLLLMTREFEPITETPLNQAGFGEGTYTVLYLSTHKTPIFLECSEKANRAQQLNL